MTTVANSPECMFCHDDHFVKVVDGMEQVETWRSKKRRRDFTGDGEPPDREYVEVELHHYEPCQACLPGRSDLHVEGHWDATHEPCDDCMPYRDPERWRRRQKAEKERRVKK